VFKLKIGNRIFTANSDRLIPLTRIYMTDHFSGLVRICTSIKSGGAKLILLAQYINRTTADRKNKSYTKWTPTNFDMYLLELKNSLFGFYICSL